MQRTERLNINIFSGPDRASIRQLLSDNDLPTADLDDLDLSCFLGCGSRASLSGVIGLEIYQRHALLRSLVVENGQRGSGCGQALVAAIECFASGKGVEHLFLLTETAEQFFSRQGYTAVDRQQLPAVIRETKELSTLCPQSATAMAKVLLKNGQTNHTR